MFPLFTGMLLARDSIVGISIPSSISLLASLFTRSVIQDPVANTLVTLLARLVVMLYYRVGLRYLSVILSNKSQSRSMPAQQTPSEIPVEHLYSHPVTLQRLIHTRYSSGVSELHDLMVLGINTWHEESCSNNIKWYDHMLRLVKWHHSSNDVIPLSNDNSCLWPGNLDHLWSTS